MNARALSVDPYQIVPTSILEIESKPMLGGSDCEVTNTFPSKEG
jgi:hypothetical protein